MRLIKGFALLVSLVSGGYVTAQEYPSKPIRLVVGFPPGGGVDLNARTLAAKLADGLRQSVIVDNRPGASGSIGAEFVVNAASDGYTLLAMSATTLTSTLLTSVRYDVLKDFTPITLLSKNPYLLVIHPSVPAQNLREFLAYAKANPGKISYSSSGNGGIVHLAAELIQATTNTQMVHVPYKGMSNAYADLFSGRIQLAISNTVSGMPYVKAGKVRALGVTSKSRMTLLPDMPTISEAGLPGFEVVQWNGLLGPAKMSKNVVDRLHNETVIVLRHPEVVNQMAQEGSEAAAGNGAELAVHMKTELDKWGAVIKRANIQAD
jgi:tripartite-type tricarboxylate transporter receptor subunit TctC